MATEIRHFTEKDNRTEAIMSMQTGETITFPISLLTSLRAQCSSFGLANNRLYKTAANRNEQTIEITRIR